MVERKSIKREKLGNSWSMKTVKMIGGNVLRTKGQWWRGVIYNAFLCLLQSGQKAQMECPLCPQTFSLIYSEQLGLLPRIHAGAEYPDGQNTGSLTSTFNEDIQEFIHLLTASHLL